MMSILFGALGAIVFVTLVSLVVGVIHVISRPTATIRTSDAETAAAAGSQGTNNPPAPATRAIGYVVAIAVGLAVVILVVLGLTWLGQPKTVVEPPTPVAPVATTYRHEIKVVAEAGNWQQEDKVDWTKVKSTVTVPEGCRGYYLYNPGSQAFAIQLPDGEVLRSNDLNVDAPRRYLPLVPGKELKLASLTGKPVEISFYWN